MVRKITREKALEYESALHSVERLPGVKFAYAVARNINILAPHVKAINNELAVSKEYDKFDQKRAEVAQEYSQKNTDGSPMIKGNEYVIDPKKQKEFDEKIEELKKQYAKAIKDREDQVENVNKSLKNEIEVDFYMLDKLFLAESINAQQINSILFMIDGETQN